MIRPVYASGKFYSKVILMPDINEPAETKSIAPSTSRALVTQSSSVVRRGLALANALLSRQDAEAYYKSGNKKVYDNYRQAVEDYTRAIEIDPDFAEAYSSRAFCFGHLKERQKELQDREAVVRGLGGCAATRLEGTGTAGVLPAILPGGPWVVVTVPALVPCARL